MNDTTIKLYQTLVKYIISLVIVLISVELILRSLGHHPYGYSELNRAIMSAPSNLFVTDSLLGYTYQSGSYKVTLNQKLTYQIKVEKDGCRHNPFNPQRCTKILNVYGCSFAAGMGVNDEEVFSAQLTKMDTNLCTKNYSIPGHGLTTQFLLFKKHLLESTKPQYAVFSVAGFHLPRNVGAFTYLRTFGNISGAPVLYPAARFTSSSTLDFHTVKVVPGIEGLARYSAIYTELLYIIDSQRWSKHCQYKVYEALADSISTLANQHNINYLFHIITNDSTTTPLINYLKLRRYPFILSEVDYKQPKMNLMPADGHPSAYAHSLYAQEIKNRLPSTH